MAKNTIADLDTTASNNTDVLGQSTSGTAAVSTIDTMIQNSLGLLARFYADIGGLGTVGGTADAITLTTASTYQALENGITLAFKAGSSITGASTINVDGLGAKAIRRLGDSATQAGDIVANGVYLLRYDTAYNAAAGAWIVLNSGGASAATTSAAGIVELATLAETLAGTDTSRAVVPANLYFPTGHISPSLTIAKNGSDASNDIDVSAFTARDSTDTYNIVCAARTKQIDAAWAVGTNAGGLDTGTVSNTTYYIWGIRRSDTGVCDVLFSLSSTAPTMPTNYDAKVLIGEFTRAGGVNGIPTVYGNPLVRFSGTAPVFACRAWIDFNGTGTPTINGSGNVSSITDNGTGDYTINFSSSMPDANYAPITAVSAGNSASAPILLIKSATQYGAPSAKLAGSCRFSFLNYADTSPSIDPAGAYIAFFR